MTEPTLAAALTLVGRHGRAGEERVRLLGAIERHGSISAAAKAAGLSYKTAWEAVNTLNNLFPKPLVLARPGGRRGGAAVVTAEGREVLGALELLQRELARFLALLSDNLQLSEPQPLLPNLLWSIAMRTSARNALRGTIAAIRPGAVNAEVVLRLSETTELAAIITNRSVEQLGLRVGGEAYALIKASFVILAPEAEAPRTSARNRLCGTVVERTRGAVNDELVLDLGQGKTLVATITGDSARELALEVGARACALINAAHVILAVD